MSRDVLLLGGAFDPPHMGHMALASRVLFNMSEKFHKDFDLWFLPSCSTDFSYKIHEKIHHRINMLNYLIHGEIQDPRITVCNIEMELNNRPGTYAVVKALIKAYPQLSFRYVMGIDQVAGIRRWRKSRDLLKSIPFVIFSRTGHTSYVSSFWFQSEPHIFFNEKPLRNPVSSSTIRSTLLGKKRDEFLNNNEATQGLPSSIKKYILEQDLYKGAKLWAATS